MRLITLVLIVFVIVYMGYHVFDALYDPLRTVTCVLVRTEASYPVTGLFVRDEILVEMPPGTLRYAVSDGERVAGGQTVAMRYEDSRVLDTAAELRLLENHLEQLLYIDNRTVAPSDSAQAKAAVQDAIAAIRDTADSGRWLMLRQNGKDLRDALFRQDVSLRERDGLGARIEETRGRINELSDQIRTSYTAVAAPQGGLFVSAADGYETLLNPAVAAALTAPELDELLKAKPETPAPNTGKLITDSTYRYVFALPETETWNLGDSVQLRFHDDVSSFMQSMNVERVSKPADGRCTVTLSSNRYLSRFYGRRRMAADLVFSEHEGLRVPREAVYFDEEDGSTYVYCRVLSQAHRKTVEIILEVERENFYLCRYAPVNSYSLLPGDEIITVGTDLYDGKVIS
jgi:hypothetical protein